MASSLTLDTCSGVISGSGLASAKIKGFSLILLIISGDTNPPFDSPRKTSAPSKASLIPPSDTSLANSDLYSFNSPFSILLDVTIPFESTIVMFSGFTPSLR